ncbi:MAG TPA: NAD-dependent epimerase/dehydratase family protein [Solirubrobacteraceae bacterium]|nr:NAD-dependent epimerase/dehydratase family protein [Solirubrobacteraceae bacterium]
MAGVGDDRDCHDRGTLHRPEHSPLVPRVIDCSLLPVTLVTGATGFIGSHVARLLVERGDDVRATVRRDTDPAALKAAGIATVTADILDRRSVRRAMSGVDRVFHIAGAISFRLSRERLMALNVEGTRIVLEEAARAGVERAVYTSSVAAIGPAPPGAMADEANVWDAGRYGIPFVDSKHEAEVVALRLIARGLPLVIVNPALVLGAGDPGRSSTTLVLRFLRRAIPAYVDGTLNVVGVEDVARGHVLADERGVPGERYILGNRNFTTDRLFADLQRLSGVERPSAKLHYPVALALAEAAARAGGRGMPAPAEVRASALNWAFRNTKAKRELGWRTAPHEDCLEETIAWYREQRPAELSPPGSRQPLALRLAAAAARRAGVLGK